MIDVLIIGAGPAGLSAAIYVERAGYHAVCLEGLTVGGQIVNTPEIENYPGIKKVSGFDFSMGLYEQATELGAEVLYEKAESIKKDAGTVGEAGNSIFRVETTSGKTIEAKAVIIATGAKNRHLGLDKEETLTGKGVSYCATCDGAFFRGKDVAVNGGGNTALEDALFLTKYCNKVYIIHRRDAFRGEPKNLEAVKNKENVELVLNSTVTELKGDKTLEAVLVKNKLDGSEREIPVQGLFIAIGQEPDNYYFKDIVSLDASGYIVADESCKTGTPGVFVAGDCRTKTVRQLTTAASDGAVAGLAAVSFIQGQ
ncbi:MAG: thioredoxin-disulfide reductase [Eubacterium sp.]|nr:thioredoxin-disulfide reductase [Eubacterium sp.]